MLNLVKERFKKLPTSRKAIFIGSIVLIVSVFMPWYSDIDRFRIGDRFLGITGPLYLTGLLVFLLGALSFGLIALELTKKPIPSLPMKEPQLHMFNGIATIFMAIIAASVYFHSKFGINVSDKTVGIGMYLSFMGGGVLIIGGILSKKIKGDYSLDEKDFESEGKSEPLIKMDERAQKGLEEEPDLDREKMTIEDAMVSSIREPQGKGWDQVQESINNYQKSLEENTTDIK